MINDTHQNKMQTGAPNFTPPPKTNEEIIHAQAEEIAMLKNQVEGLTDMIKMTRKDLANKLEHMGVLETKLRYIEDLYDQLIRQLLDKID